MKNKIISIFTSIFFCVSIFVGSMGYLFTTNRDFSEEENRTLRAFPRHAPHALAKIWFDGKLSRELDGFYSDRLLFRPQLTSVFGMTDSALHASAAQGVLHGDGGQLAVYLFDAYISPSQQIEDTDLFDESHIINQCNSVKNVAKFLSQKDIPLYLLPAPRVVDVCAPALGYPTDTSDRLDKIIENELADAQDLTLINMLAPLRDAYLRGEYVVYKTDHHWTTGGAYLAYREIMKNISPDAKPLEKSQFSIRKINNFVGTTASRACLGNPKLCSPDVLEVWEAADDCTFTASDGNGFEMQGFIDENYLSRKDKYGAFLSGTRNFLTISDGGKKPRLLVARDSFANSVIPFLARHFDIVSVNLSGGMYNITQYADDYAADAVLILYNRENMISADHLGRIK